MPRLIPSLLPSLALSAEVLGFGHPVGALPALIVVVCQGHHVLLLERRVRLHEVRVEVDGDVRGRVAGRWASACHRLSDVGVLSSGQCALWMDWSRVLRHKTDLAIGRPVRSMCLLRE